MAVAYHDPRRAKLKTPFSPPPVYLPGCCRTTCNESPPAVTRDRGSLLGILAGILARLGFFTDNRYYPDIGAPYTIGVPATAAVVFTLLAYVLIDYQ